MFQAIELYKRFRSGAQKNPKKPLHAAILDSHPVVARGVALDKLKKRRVLSCAPFRHTCVLFWTDCKYQGHSMQETLGWHLAAMLWDDEEETLTLFQLNKKTGQIGLVPKGMTEELHLGLTHHLAVVWSGLAQANPTKDFWGKQQHYFTKDRQTAPPEYSILGSYRADYSDGLESSGERAYQSDVRGSLKLSVKRSKKVMKPEDRERFERGEWQIFEHDELLDDQTARLLLSKGHKDKRAGEWLACKTTRAAGYHFQTYGGKKMKTVPVTRVSTL